MSQIENKEEMTQEEKEAMQGREFIYFEGDDQCESGCRGWNGIRGRCDCGSRRVEWTESMPGTGLYGEAY